MNLFSNTPVKKLPCHIRTRLPMHGVPVTEPVSAEWNPPTLKNLAALAGALLPRLARRLRYVSGETYKHRIAFFTRMARSAV